MAPSPGRKRNFAFRPLAMPAIVFPHALVEVVESASC